MGEVAIIGAGVAGLACAVRLRAEGVTVRLFDKGRGPGGRLATRRTDDGGQFDHGAQLIKGTDPAFQAQLEAWRREGRIAPWPGPFGTLRPDGLTPSAETGERFTGVPKMNAVPRGDSQTVAFSHRISAITRTGEGWHLEEETKGPLGTFAQVVVAVPAPQAATLLQPMPAFAHAAEQAVYAPCWTVMARFASALPVPFEGAAIHGSPLSWIARERGKPGRPETAADHWVLQASPDWSRDHLEAEPDQITPLLLDAFRDCLGWAGLDDLAPADIARGHRWRYSQIEKTPVSPALKDGALWDEETGLGACGDWCLGPRVEHAWLSGRALAAQLLAGGLAARG